MVVSLGRPDDLVALGLAPGGGDDHVDRLEVELAAEGRVEDARGAEERLLQGERERGEMELERNRPLA